MDFLHAMAASRVAGPLQRGASRFCIGQRTTPDAAIEIEEEIA
jgi:hypothetical protein